MKPELGLKPRWLHDEMRISGLLEGIGRYAKAGQPVNPEWVDELSDLVWTKCKRPAIDEGGRQSGKTTRMLHKILAEGGECLCVASTDHHARRLAERFAAMAEDGRRTSHKEVEWAGGRVRFVAQAEFKEGFLPGCTLPPHRVYRDVD